MPRCARRDRAGPALASVVMSISSGARDPKAVTPQTEDFSGWYNDVVFRAQMVDRGPVKGTMVIRPYGYRMWELLQGELDRRIKATGPRQRLLPAVDPAELLPTRGGARRGLRA